MTTDATADDVIAALRAPASLAALDPRRLSDVISRARAAAVLGRIAARARRDGSLDTLSGHLREILLATSQAMAAHRLRTGFAVDRIARILAAEGVPVVLLKGAAYALADLPPAEGRPPGDIDILVPRACLASVEARLKAAGWEDAVGTRHAQRYFRSWMHELPPLWHRDLGAVVDVHHAILPPLGRLGVASGPLLAAACPIPALPALRMLAPADMALHCILHHFQDGEFRHTLRELVDLDDLLRHFGPAPGFWTTLRTRMAEFGAERPAGYALRLTRSILGTPVPAATLSAAMPGPRPDLTARITENAMRRALGASGRPERGTAEWLGARCLAIRAHWLKLPPRLLVRNAGGKLAARLTSAAGRRAS